LLPPLCPALPPERLGADEATKKRLKEAQRAWIAFRDAECDFATSGSRDGSIYPMIQGNASRASPTPAANSCRATSIARRAT
jgi:hypothetical protein